MSRHSTQCMDYFGIPPRQQEAPHLSTHSLSSPRHETLISIRFPIIPFHFFTEIYTQLHSFITVFPWLQPQNAEVRSRIWWFGERPARFTCLHKPFSFFNIKSFCSFWSGWTSSKFATTWLGSWVTLAKLKIVRQPEAKWNCHRDELNGSVMKVFI